jgi:hypothetical protein
MADSSLSANERSLRARLAVHSSWARTTNPSERTRPGREAAFEKFRRQVDPDGKLSPEERDRRARHAQRAHMLELSLRASKARRKQRGDP